MSVRSFSKTLTVGFAALLLGGVSANAGLVYLDTSSGQLFAGDPTTATYTLVGTDPKAAAFGGFTDIDFTANGNLYGLDPSGNLYRIDPNTGLIISEIGNTGVTDGSLVGLAGDGSGNLTAGGVNNIYSIDTGTGLATAVGTGGGGYATEGDLDYAGNGNLYLTSSLPNAGQLFLIDQTTGAGSNLGQLQDGSGHAFGNVFGVAYDSDNGVFYGYDAAGTQFDINVADPTNSAQGDVTYSVVGESGALLGAAFVSTPEPASMALIGFGMLGLGLATRKRRAC